MEVVQIASNNKRKDSIAQLSSDPNNKFWTNDKSRFGFKMLMKMGWSEGKGLGKNEQGMSTYVKATKNDEKSGLGEKEDKGDWKANNLNYNQLLSNLTAKYAPKPQPQESDSSSSSESEPEEKPKKKKKEEEAAPESPKASKQVDKIIFTKRHKAKQVSKYSKDDMKAILGIKEESKHATQKETEFESDIPVIVHKESMTEYFQKKLDGQVDEEENQIEETIEQSKKKEKKEKKHKKEKKSKKEVNEEQEEAVEVEPEENGKQDVEVKKEKKRKNKEIAEEAEDEQKVKKEKKDKKEKKKRKHAKESNE